MTGWNYITLHWIIHWISCKLFFSHFSGQCNPNPCENNGVCEEKGKRRFKCDCPAPFKGRRCQRGLGKKSLHACCRLVKYVQYIIRQNEWIKKKVSLLLLSQVQKFVKGVDVVGVSVCWPRLPRSLSANASIPSRLHTAELVRKYFFLQTKTEILFYTIVVIVPKSKLTLFTVFLQRYTVWA